MVTRIKMEQSGESWRARAKAANHRCFKEKRKSKVRWLGIRMKITVQSVLTRRRGKDQPKIG